MSTRAIVEEKAKELAEFEAIERGQGMANTQVEHDKRVAQEASFRIARDRADHARNEYRRAFEQWRINGFKD